METSLGEEDGHRLLQLARLAVGHAARGEPLPPLPLAAETERLRRAGCAFVTLTERGLLRGCIGGLEPRLPLAEDVWEHAYAAARKDFRFEPVRAQELPDLAVEVSVLTEPQPLPYSGREDLVRKLRPGVDGVILSSGIRRATFLPQVWEKIPEAEEFLDRLAEKAGLPSETWHRGEASIQIYQVVSFHEGHLPIGA